MTDTRSIFVIRDFANHGLSHLLDEAKRKTAGQLDWDIPGKDDGSKQGSIRLQRIAKGLASASRVLANVDQANANAAFEIGYSLGKERPTAIFVSRGKPPEWLGRAPFGGHSFSTGNSADSLIELAIADEADTYIPFPGAPNGGEVNLLLAPSDWTGATFGIGCSRNSRASSA